MPGDAVTLAISGPSLWGCSMVGMWEHHILIAKQNRLTLSFLLQARGYTTGLAINAITRKGASRPWPGVL